MEALKIWLRDTGTSQAELAKDLDVSQVSVSGWVTGKFDPSRENLRKLSARTGLSMDELLREPVISGDRTTTGTHG